MKQSIWLASGKNVEQYRKYDAKTIINDVTNEFRGYSTFDGLHKGIVVGRIMNAVKQSLRVRGVNVLFNLRRSLINYEKELTTEIRILQNELNICKAACKVYAVNLDDPQISKKDIIRHYKERELRLKTKVKLESKILERKVLRQHLKTTADDILKENK